MEEMTEETVELVRVAAPDIGKASPVACMPPRPRPVAVLDAPGIGKSIPTESGAVQDHHHRLRRGSRVPAHPVIGLTGYQLPGLARAGRRPGCSRT